MDYRFFRRQEYEIAEADKIIIYKTYESILGEKVPKTVTRYSFSKNLDSEILPLTLDNLKIVIPDDHQLHHKIDMEFKTDKDLAGFDTAHKKFRINLLLVGHEKR